MSMIISTLLTLDIFCMIVKTNIINILHVNSMILKLSLCELRLSRERLRSCEILVYELRNSQILWSLFYWIFWAFNLILNLPVELLISERQRWWRAAGEGQRKKRVKIFLQYCSQSTLNKYRGEPSTTLVRFARFQCRFRGKINPMIST